MLTNLSTQPEEYQKALLLHSLGPEGVRLYNGMSFSTGEDSGKVSIILRKLDEHFLGVRREYFERFKFNRRNQGEHEGIDEYMSILRTMAKTCGFCVCMSDNLIMDHLLLGVSDDTMRERMMATHDLTLSKAIDICKAIEAAKSQMHALRNDAVHKVSSKPPARKWKQKPAQQSTYQEGKAQDVSSSQRKCKFCRRAHEMKKESCPAWGQKCNACRKLNHFKGSTVCKAKDVRHVEEDECSSSGESISYVTEESVNAVKSDAEAILCNMILNDQVVTFQIDCGATVNLLPKRYLDEQNEQRDHKVRLQMWNKSTTRAIGRCKIKTRNPANQAKYKVDYVVVDDDFVPLLSRSASEKMGLINVNYDAIQRVHNITRADIVEEFSDVFSQTRVGVLPGNKVHLQVDEDTQPSIRPSRSVPEALKSAVKAELDHLKERDIVEEVSVPTDWVNQMSVAQKKSGKVRLCLDPRSLNVVLKREHYPLPVLDDVLPELSTAKLFSICDLKDGYLHCTLDEPSSYLTTFATPWGRYRWKRLPFGLKVSSEIFQKSLHQALDGLDGVRCVADDIIIWAGDEIEHDSRLRKLLQRCKDVGIVLNKDKCRFLMKEIAFLGHIVTSSGLKPDPSKIEAIVNMPAPTKKDDIDRLRGMINYLARYLPKLSEVMQPLNELTHKNVAWTWNANHERAFNKLKTMLTEAPVLTYFDQNKKIVLQTDASARGLGATMMQDGKPIAYASRGLSDAETRYSVIEKEMLAIVFALEKWNQFTFGREVLVYTDHKPLEAIVKKSLDRAPKRLQGMLLRALAYDVQVKYLRGKDNLLADPLSRVYLPYKVGQEEFEVVNAVSHLALADEQIAEMRRMTAQDETLQLLKRTILDGWPDHKSQVQPAVTLYFGVRDELTVTDGLVFRGERVVVPKAMRKRVKADLHTGHNGVDGTLRRAREYVYWPNMTKDISEWIQTCETCMEYLSAQQPQPLMPHQIPDRPWQKIGVDLLHYDGKEYLVTVCYKSNFWELDRVHKTTARTITTKLSGHFSRYGLPDTLVSDNGPPFSSKEFDTFTREMGIKHQTISPYNSKANGKVEAAVKSTKKMLKRCQRSGEDENMALLNLRNTPSQGVDSSPVQRFLGRRTKTKIPTHHSLLEPRLPESKHEMQQLLLNQKRQQKYFDRHARTLPDLEDGDVVRMAPFRAGEDRWRKAVVIRRLDERSYEVEQQGTIYRRNREHLRASRETPDMDNPYVISTESAGHPNIGIQSTSHPETGTSSPVSHRSASHPETGTFSPVSHQDSRRSPGSSTGSRNGPNTRSCSHDDARSDLRDVTPEVANPLMDELPAVPLRRSTRQRRKPDYLKD